MSAKTAYCKVCHDAGKPESVYRSHYVKSEPGPKGKIICPTLLSQCCRYCDKTGHTVKHCPVLSQKSEKKDDLPSIKSNPKPANKKSENPTNPTKTTKTTKKTNMYEALYSDDESEKEEILYSEESKDTSSEMFPALTNKKTANKETTQSVSFSYASIAAKTSLEIKQKNEEKILKDIKQRILPPLSSTNINKTAPKKKRSWADSDSSTSEDEDDCDDEYLQYPLEIVKQMTREGLINESWIEQAQSDDW